MRFFGHDATAPILHTVGGAVLGLALSMSVELSPNFGFKSTLPWGILLGLITLLLLIGIGMLAARSHDYEEASSKRALVIEQRVKENTQFILSSVASFIDSSYIGQQKVAGNAWDPIMRMCELLFPVPVRAQVFVVDEENGRKCFKAAPNGFGMYRRETASTRVFDEDSTVWKNIQAGKIHSNHGPVDSEDYGCYLGRGIVAKTGEIYGFFAVDAQDPDALSAERDRESLAYLSTLLLLVMTADPSITESTQVTRKGNKRLE